MAHRRLLHPRFRHAGCAGLVAALAVVCAAPASASEATPIADTLRAATQAVDPAVSDVVDRTVATLPAAKPALRRLRADVTAVTGAQPVRTTVATLRGQVERTTTAAEPVVASVAGRASGAATPAVPGDGGSSSPIRRATAPAESGRIDRRAGRRTGAPAHDGRGSAPSQVADRATAAPTDLVATSAATTERLRSDASSATASGDDGQPTDDTPAFGHDGGERLLGGPAGIALVALGLLAALLTLVPRFSSRLLQLSPTRWGSAAFLVPIERPG
jgi:hypothetical protein